MKAIFFEQHGEIDVLKYADLPDPTPGPGEALIRVKGVALNHLDIWVRRGWKGLHLEMPHITGSDIAGEIVSVNGYSQLPTGARVIVNPGILGVSDEWTRNGLDSANLLELFKWTQAEFDQRLQGSAIRRIGHAQWLRNIAIALGNAPPSTAILAALETQAQHPDAVVAEHVSWAIEQQRERLSKTKG